MNYRKTIKFVLVVLGISLAPAPVTAQETVDVAASIPPIHALVSTVLGDRGRAGLLLSAGESPHHATLKPSQRQMIAEAEAVFIISHDFEQYLQKALVQNSRVVELVDTPGLNLLPWRTFGEDDHHDTHGVSDHHDSHDDGHDTHGVSDHHESHEDHDGHDTHGVSDHHESHEDHHDANEDHHDDHDGHDSHEGHAHGGEYDLHFWLNPLNAVILLPSIAEELANIWPEHRAYFAENARQAQIGLIALDTEIAARMAPLQNRKLVLFHDAFQYFEHRYGLTVLETLLDPHAGAISAARLLALETLFAEEQPDCIFSEPQFDEKLVLRLQNASGAKRGTLDPLGQDIPAGAGQYADLLRAIASAIESCTRG